MIKSYYGSRAGLGRIFVLLFCFVNALTCNAQLPSGKDHIRFDALPTLTGAAGDTVHLRVKAKIDRHWHSYGVNRVVGPDGLGPDATEFSVKPKNVLQVLTRIAVVRGAHEAFDETWGAKVTEISGLVEFDIPVRIDHRLAVGTARATLVVGMQMCDTAQCLPFEEIELPLSVTVTAASTTTIAADDTATSTSSASTVQSTPAVVAGAPAAGADADIEKEKSKGLWSFFLYAMGIGFLALLTPCVFPMIPITVSFFTKRHEKRRGRGIQESALFGLGIISTFTAVGIIASIIFGGTAVQDLAANPWLNLGIGALFMVLAFNLFGAFEIQIPVSIMNALNKKSQGDGSVSILLMGLTFSLTSFTCTVPFVGTLLLSASGGDYLFPAVGTLGFATAFALPFVGLSLFPSLLVRLPRAGGWMNNLKVVMGFLEVAAAVKFFSTAEFIFGLGLLPREVFLAVWAGVCFLIVLYLVGTFEMKLDSTLEKVSGLRAVFAIVFATLGFWFVGGINGKPLAADLEALLPPENYHELVDQINQGTSGSTPKKPADTKATQSHDALPWMQNIEEARRIAREQNKPIFIDFTGFSCVNCRKMEKTVFAKPAVIEALQKFVLVQLYTDRKSEPYITNQNLLKTYGTVANPLYVLLKPDGSFVAKTGYQIDYSNDPRKFVTFLNQAL